MPRKYNVFVSHATRPNANARELVSALVASLRSSYGLSVFLDFDSLGSEVPLLSSLEEAIENSDLALLVVTQRGSESGWAGWERQRFRERQLARSFPVIALRFDSAQVLPDDLTWVAIIEADSSVPVDRVAREIARHFADLVQRL